MRQKQETVKGSLQSKKIRKKLPDLLLLPRIAGAGEVKEFAMEDLLERVQNPEEEYRIKDETYHKLYPARDSRQVHDNVRERICNEDRTEDTDEKRYPFPDRCHIHNRYWGADLIKP